MMGRLIAPAPFVCNLKWCSKEGAVLNPLLLCNSEV